MRTLFVSAFLIFSIIAVGQDVNWSYKMDSAAVFSSPRFADLNKDGVLDVVIGAGNENYAIKHGIVAIDGKTGEVLWSYNTRSQIYTSAIFQDINGDGYPDVFIGGRNAQLYAIDGKTGTLIWQFWSGTYKEARAANYHNFYVTQFLEDQNKDGIKDLLVSNDGDAYILPNDTNRPRGKIMMICGAKGKTIAQDELPHHRETYYAPHIYYKKGKKKPMVIYASGGETIDGCLWEVSLKNLRKEKLKKSKVILKDTVKGFIVNSVLADLNHDGTHDIINTRLNSVLTAVDGKSGDVLWEHLFPGYECYVAPTVGHFVGDDTPDIFITIAKGAYPNYASFDQLVIDGSTGEIVSRTSNGIYQFASALAVDINGDGWDEIIYNENKIDVETHATTNQFRIIDLHNDTSEFIGERRTGTCFSSTPGIVDLDGDGKLELVFAYSNSLNSEENYSVIECIKTEYSVDHISFPGYLGRNENGLFDGR